MKTILIVEDDKYILKALTIRFASKGYKVITAMDAACGTIKSIKNQPDLMILDICMPGGDGFDIAERVRLNAETQRTPIIFITANNDYTMMEKAMRYDAADFFHKPYVSSDLIRTVDGILH